MKKIHFLFVIIAFASLPGVSLAYVGPGAGLTAIGSVLAFVGTMLLLVIGFVWYPLKRMRQLAELG